MHSINCTTLAILSLFLPRVIFRCDSISCLVMKKMRFEWYLKIKLNTKHLKLIFYIETL